MGDLDDVMPLLSYIGSSNRLRRTYDNQYNDNDNEIELVDENTLSGKYILFCCVHFPVAHGGFNNYDHIDAVCPQTLINACYDVFFVREDFEMVVVMKPDELDYFNDDSFCDLMRLLPGLSLVIPFNDSESRDFVCDYLNMDEPGLKYFLVNVERNIVCQGQIDSVSNLIECLQGLYRECSFDLPRCYGRLVKSMWPVVREEQIKRRWGRSRRRCPIARKINVQEPEYTDEINNMVLESQKSCAIEIGNSIDVVSLLSGEGDLNYLERNDGERVEVEEKVFSGKYVIVCCFYVPVFREDICSSGIQCLANLCNELYSTKSDVEIVVVVKMNKLVNHELVFNHFLTGFPSSCLVVPFKDSKRSDFICKYLDLGLSFSFSISPYSERYMSVRCLVLDTNRNIILCGYPDHWWNQGADVFPFTDEKLQEIRANKYEYLKWEAPFTTTLEGLLGCSPSDVVYKINSAGVREQEITVSELREKVVGLYLSNGWERYTMRLHEVYEECRAKNLAFEIVLVYIPFDDCLDPEAYKANTDSMLQKQNISTNWWRLPFNNSVSQRLHKLTQHFCDYGYCSQQLIIVGPHDEYVERYGAHVMYNFGIDAYPFTKECLIERGLKKLRELTLESLLVYGSRDYVIRGDDKIAVSQLQGRNLIVYLDHLGKDLDLYDKLLNWYDEIKAKHPSFEVVFVRIESSSISSNTEIEDESVLSAIMPWLICPFDPDHSASVAKKIFIEERTSDTLIQFGEDGRIYSTEAQRLLRKQGPGDFPFGDNLRKEVIHQLHMSEYCVCNSGFY